jgi:hypothetical protein
MWLTPAPEARRAVGSYSVPDFCLVLKLGSHCSPGYFSDAIWIDGEFVQPVFCFSMSVLDQANNSRRLVSVNDDSDVSSFTTHIQLCSAGFLVEFEVTAFHSRFTD